ncbi:MAG: pectin esterase [Clostridia bacterium]|nr:pectin esterase [Clostridia bacterium]
MKIIRVTPDDDLQSILAEISQPTTIYLKKGVYDCKLIIAADDVKLIGEERETTIIRYGDYAKKAHADGREYNTFRTFTVCVTGERVVIENLTIANTNDSPELVGQCVALSVNARLFHAVNVDLRSTQDTLFTAPFPDDLVIRYAGLTDDKTYYDGFIPRDQLYMEGNSFHYYENCAVYGTVDFIFGGAQALFENCRLVSLNDKRKLGFVAAPSHSLRQEYGYLFHNCVFANGGAEDKGVYLARPWRDFGRCDFINCRLESHISPALFDKWNDTYRDKTARFGYYNLTAESLTPVPWAKQHTTERASEIINAFTALKKKYFDE